jgi:putative MATE family efflux protein
MDTSKQLGEDKILSLILRFSIPAIVGMLVNALYNVVDRIFIGNGVGSLGIAGITVAFPIMVIIMAYGMLIGFGSTSLLSIRLGEDKRKEAELIMGNGMTLLIVGAVILSVGGLLFLEPLLIAFGASKEVLPYAVDYTTIILFGTVFQAIGFGMNNYIRALGSPKTAMLTMVIGAVLNVLLDPLFIFVFGWGIKGAALATVISQSVSAFWVLHYFFGGKSFLKIRWENLRLHYNSIARFLPLGFPPFIMQIASSLLLTIMNRSLLVHGGDIAISATGVVMSINTLVFMPVLGMKQGVQPIIGYNYGARNIARVRQTVKMGIVGATGILLVGFFFTMLFPSEIVSLFGKNDHELIRIGARAIRIVMISLPVVGFQIITSAYFQAVGKPRQATILTLSRQILILIPLMLILPLSFGLDGIFASIPIADITTAFLSAGLLYHEHRRLKTEFMNPLSPQIVPEYMES